MVSKRRLEFDGENPDLPLNTKRKHRSGEPAELTRYTIRRDGFVSRHADSRVRTLLTKPIRFSGNRLYLNFKTSALGYLFTEIMDQNGHSLDSYRSCELFGDSTVRPVVFPQDLIRLAGLRCG